MADITVELSTDEVVWDVMSEEQHAAGVIGAAIAQRAAVCYDGGDATHADLIGSFVMDPDIDPHDVGKARERAGRAHALLRTMAESRKFPPASPLPSSQGVTTMMAGATTEGDKWVPGYGAAAIIRVLDDGNSAGFTGTAGAAVVETVVPIRRRLGI